METLGAPELIFAELPMAADRGIGWKTVRDAGRVVLIDGWYYLSHREDVLAALRDPELFSSKKAFDVLGSPVPLVPIAFDPPEQARYRRILQPFFSPRMIKPLEPDLRKQIADLIEPIAQRGECDFIAEVA